MEFHIMELYTHKNSTSLVLPESSFFHRDWKTGEQREKRERRGFVILNLSSERLDGGDFHRVFCECTVHKTGFEYLFFTMCLFGSSWTHLSRTIQGSSNNGTLIWEKQVNKKRCYWIKKGSLNRILVFQNSVHVTVYGH